MSKKKVIINLNDLPISKITNLQDLLNKKVNVTENLQFSNNFFRKRGLQNR